MKKKMINYVNCAVCGKRIRAQDDDYVGDDAYYILERWVCEDCVHDSRREAIARGYSEF